MFIFFTPDTRRVTHIMTMAPTDYRSFLESNPPQGEAWVETNESFQFEEIEVLPDHSIQRRAPLPIVAPESIKVGEEFKIHGIAKGVSIIVNGAELGVMDETEVLEFTANTGGLYKFRFEGSGYIMKEITLEAVA